MARLLVVDDDDDIRTLLTKRLSRRGHEVLPAATCDQARAATAAVPAELIISDVVLPDGSGMDLVADLRRAGDHAPVVFLSGRSEATDVARGAALGATYLTKPVVLAVLIETIDRLLPGATPGGTASRQWNPCGGTQR